MMTWMLPLAQDACVGQTGASQADEPVELSAKASLLHPLLLCLFPSWQENHSCHLTTEPS